ncbi:transposase [Photorhabdus heterorhabditis]|uniref:transposase n=1 Tax=Photorhabdus heterorhabditis TaxID=880156 RepID=UPI00092FD50D|nr:transposase [Photorhabdus heterorhabditis]
MNAQEEDIRRLLTLPGIGPLGAFALMIALGESTDFKNGRHFASYLGLVLREHSSGGKVGLLGITKRGGWLFARNIDSWYPFSCLSGAKNP